jgi:hypothetical protein
MPALFPVKYIDSPVNKTVTAVMNDNTEIIILDMSNANYTNPPGYLDFTTDINIIKTNLAARTTQYRVSLNAQLST